jgi:cytochrome c oxidase subunit 2
MTFAHSYRHRKRVMSLLGTLALAAAACGPTASSTPPSAAPTAPTAPKPAAAPTPNPAAVAEGQALVAQKGCGGCHIIPAGPGATGTVGPNLAGVASRPAIAGGAVPNNGPDDLKRWILNPPAVKPGTQMPNLGLTDDEATKIVASLETLK